MKRIVELLTVSAFLLGTTDAAIAQRAEDNAVTSADDAFGTTVGNETTGLYSSQNARGFSPQSSGNVRIEGLFFDRQGAQPTSRLFAGSTIHVGISAQSYPFPAPTGIVDFQLRLPGDEPIQSLTVSYGPFDKLRLKVDTQTPIVDGKLGLLAGAGIRQDAYEWPPDSMSWSAGRLLKWKPTEDIEIIPFWSRSEKYDWEVQPYIYPAGTFLSPDIHRRSYFSQEWADWETRDTSFGMLPSPRCQ